MSYKISALIENICKDLEIDYTSPYHGKLLERQKNAMRLAQAYLQLKEIIELLSEMKTKYPEINGLKDIFKKDIVILEKIDHDIFMEAHKIVRKNGNKRIDT